MALPLMFKLWEFCNGDRVSAAGAIEDFVSIGIMVVKLFLVLYMWRSRILRATGAIGILQ